MTQDQQGISGNRKLRATSGQRKLGLTIFLVVVLGLAGVSVLEAIHFDIGRLFTPCGFKVRHGLPCPTCGYTRALRALVSGHVAAAFSLQPAAGLIYLGLLVSAMIGGYVAFSGYYPDWLHKGLKGWTPKRVFWCVLGIVIMGWIVQLIRAWVGH